MPYTKTTEQSAVQADQKNSYPAKDRQHQLISNIAKWLFLQRLDTSHLEYGSEVDPVIVTQILVGSNFPHFEYRQMAIPTKMV